MILPLASVRLINTLFTFGAFAMMISDGEEALVSIDKDLICHTLQGKPIKPKTLGQKKYVDAIRNIVFVTARE